jgi:mRNA interferase MazF
MRPCLVVSPDELNDHVQTLVVPLLTTGSYSYPFRVACRLQNQLCHVVPNHIRTVDREHLVRHLGTVSPQALQPLLVLQEMFAL